MKKFSKLLLAIAVLSVCAFPACAAMKRMEYATFSIDIPDSWVADKQELDDGDHVLFGPLDDTSVCSVLVLPSNGLTSKTFAENLRESMKGTELVDNGDGFYSFTYVEEGVETRNLLGVLNQSAIFITVAGDDPDLLAIAASLRFKLEFRPNVKGLF